MRKARIAIVGYGFVGKATSKGFSKNTELFLVDPLLGTKIHDLVQFKPDFIFVCVPTPMTADGSQDFKSVTDVFSEIKTNKISACVVLKSTVIPSNIKPRDLDDVKAGGLGTFFIGQIMDEVAFKTSKYDWINHLVLIKKY